MASVGGLQAELSLNSAKFVQGMNEAKGHLASLSQGFSQVGNMLKEFAILAGAGFGLGFAKSVMAEVDALQDFSQEVGINVEKLSVMKSMAGHVGIEFEGLIGLLDKMSKNVSGAANGTNSATDAFSRLGISVYQLEKLKPDEQFDFISKALEGVEKHSDKVAIAMEIFGQSGAQVVKMLGEEGNSLSEVEGKLRRHNLILSEETIKANSDLEKSMNRLGKSFKVDMAEKIAIVSPAVIELINSYMNLRDEVKVFVEESMGKMEDAFDKIKPQFDVLVENMKDFGAAAFNAATDVARLSLEGLGELSKEFLKLTGYTDEATQKMTLFGAAAEGIGVTLKGLEATGQIFTGWIYQALGGLYKVYGLLTESAELIAKGRELGEFGALKVDEGLQTGDKNYKGDPSLKVKDVDLFLNKITSAKDLPIVPEIEQLSENIEVATQKGSEFIGFWDELKKRMDKASDNANLFDPTIKAFQIYAKNANNTADGIRTAFEKAFKGAEDALTKFLTDGKFTLQSLLDATKIIAQQIQQELVRALVVKPFVGAAAKSFENYVPQILGALSIFAGGGGEVSGAMTPGQTQVGSITPPPVYTPSGPMTPASLGDARPTVVNMTINTPDANSFMRNQGDLLASIRLASARANRNL